MTEVSHAEISRLLQSKRNESTAIVASRKRKLRELFAVATHVESLPNDAFANPDAPSAAPVEWQFLQANDILQGKTLNELNIPPRPRLSIEALKQLLSSVRDGATDQTIRKPADSSVKDVRPAAPEGGRPTERPKPSSVAPLKPVAPPARSLPVKEAVKPIPEAIRPPPQPQQSSVPLPKPIATPIPPPTIPSEANKKPATEATDSRTKIDDPQLKRPVQVSFPPGTKGSPSSGTSENTAIVDSTDSKAGDAPASPQVNGNGLLTVPPTADSTKVSDAPSSPGSTAPSATTPAVHDISADTSPENEGLHYMDVAEQKVESSQENAPESNVANTDGKTAVEDQDPVAAAASASAEDQLLQESIRSSAAPTIPDNAATGDKPAGVVSTESKPETCPSNLGGDAPSEPQKEAQPKPDEMQKQEDESFADPPKSSMEIPDSEEEASEKMDVDVEVTDAPAKHQDVLTPHESNLPTQSTPAAFLPTKPISKENPPSAPERAVTRVSSGAMRLKSVNEIVGSSPRPSQLLPTTKGPDNQLTPITSTSQSPITKNRNGISHRRDRSKSQVSTVVFGKQPKRVEEKSLVPGQREAFQPSDDYFTPLFLQAFTGSSNVMQPMEKILFHANKTVATTDANLAIQDFQACKVLRKVYQLQHLDKWSLRQPKRCPEPTRPPSQWDVTMQEMKWMRTDFREERKWKMAVAKNLAYACVEWHNSSPEMRKSLQVAAVIPPKSEVQNDISMADSGDDALENQLTPDLVSSGDMDSPQPVDELNEVFVETVAPSAIFTLQEDDVVFGLRRTATSDQLLEELPMYGSPLKVPTFELTGPEFDPDAHWRRPALPLSKFVEGQMKLASDGPPRKRSRYDYQNEDSDDENDGDFIADQALLNDKLPPSTDEVALFNPESKPIRDRLHAGHQFRPPSEHPMPTQSFYECRSPSQWILTEDDELRGLVRDYSYNWSLISSILSTRSLFVSGAERRTPWECFERWINLEGLPADMQKTQYFKAYNSRIESAQRVIAQQNQMAAQQANAAGGAVTPIRRRQSTPLRVERRRNQKHLTLIDAMRKLAKKRETTIQKQQHSASQNVANKKPADPVSQRPIKTPRDYSLLRWERDQALAEKMAQYAQRQEAQRRAAMQARAQGQAAQMAGTPVPAQTAQAANHAGVNAAAVNGVNRANIPSQLAAAAAAANQGRPRMPMQAPPNGMVPAAIPAQMNGGLMPPGQMNGIPQAQMQGVQAQHRIPMPNQQADASLMLRAQRISEQQRAAVQIQQAQQHQQHQQQQAVGPGTPAPPTPQNASANLRNGVNGMTQQSFINNAQAMMASFNANGGGHGTPPANGLHMPSVANGSPGPRVQPQIPPSIATQLNQLEAQFRAKNPNLTPEQARQLATEHLTRAMMAQRQSAMNAAAGASGQPGIANSIAATTSPHQYAALLRQQQQQQQQQQHQTNHATAAAGAVATAASSPGQAHQRQSSGSVTPSISK